MHGKSINKYLVVITVIALAYFAIWTYYGIHKYNTYNTEYYDIGIYAYAMYWHIHYAAGVAPILYISTFANHVSLFMPLILPLFYLYQSPAMLYIIQGMALAITTVLVYIVTNDITKSMPLGFAFAVAFMINPGIRGLTIFDSHFEAFIPFFYIFSFYFFIKGKKALFCIGMIFLLSIIEATFPVALTLLAGLLIYELLYGRVYETKKGFHDKMLMLGVGFMITIIFIGFYILVINTAISSYPSVPSTTVPPIIRTLNFISVALSKNNLAGYNGVILGGGFVDLIMLLFGFGILTMANPLISIILYSPWLFEVFVEHDPFFVAQTYQYLAYVVGASYVSAIIGYLILSKRHKSAKASISLLNINIKKSRWVSPAFVLTLSIIISVEMFFVSGAYYTAFYTPNSANYTQINSALALIPINATVMAQQPIAAHLYYIKELELPPPDNPINPALWHINVTTYWFKPQYVVIDSRLSSYSELVNSSNFNIYNYTKYNYTVYYNESGLEIFKKNNQT
jgi:uncharacterized membrane protein